MSFLARARIALFIAALNIPAAGTAATVNLEALAKDPSWLRLVHYEADRKSSSGWRSAIHSPEFFLAGATGQVDPHAELAATVAAMGAPPPPDAIPDDHPQCRFPARRLWLARHLSADILPALDCPKFSAWNQSANVDSISIVFATGYLGNPASYYGHTLLKFNFARDHGKTSLQDASVNYGAILTGNDGPLTYIFKGVTGGYEGGFSHVDYYFHNHNYGENELRDLWEYRLALPRDALDFVVAHAWEVLGQRYIYYFFRKNCAFRMAEILEVVDGLHVIPEEQPWTIPQALLQQLAASRFNGHPLVSEVVRHPSRQSRFYQSYVELAPEAAGILHAVAKGGLSFESAEFTALPLRIKHAIIDGLIDYYQFVASADDRASGKIHPGYAAALAARFELPPGQTATIETPHPPPHLGRPPSWFQIGLIHSSDSGTGLSLRVRPAYYDSLDTGSGHVPNAVLAMGDVQFDIRRDQLRIRRFDLVAVDSVNPGISGLPGDRGAAWKFRLGAEPRRPDCEDCTVARLQGDIGIGRRLTERVFAAAYVGGALQESRQDSGSLLARASADLIMRPHADVGIRMGYEQRIPIDRAKRTYGVTYAEARVAIDKKNDIRIRVESAAGYVATIGLGVYW